MDAPDVSSYHGSTPEDALRAFAFDQRAAAASNSWLGGASRHLLQVVIGLAAVLCFWTLVINVFVAKVNKSIKQEPLKFETKPLKFDNFDIDGFRKSMGLPPR